MSITMLAKEVKPLWERVIEDRCRDLILELESTDDHTELEKLVHKVVAWLRDSPKITEIFLRVDSDIEDESSGVEERFLAGASQEVAAAYVRHWRQHCINREARAYIRAACQDGLFAFAVPPLLCTQ